MVGHKATGPAISASVNITDVMHYMQHHWPLKR